MSLNILDRINHGFGELEPVILGALALRLRVLLVGKHGTGKTRLASVLSAGIGEGSFVAYDAPKDDLISVAGIPEVDTRSDAPFTFRRHKRTIWDKKTVLVDEITRAGRESQNLWLEILENRTCFGDPLAYEVLIATANPETYEAAFKLDAALMDRFHVVVPVPELQLGVTASQVGALIRLARGDVATPTGPEITRALERIRRAHDHLLQHGASERVAEYLEALVPKLFRVLGPSSEIYVSPRTYARNLPEAVLAAAAYFEAAGDPAPLDRGVRIGLRYALSTKLLIKPAVLDQLHAELKSHLVAAGPEAEDRVHLGFLARQDFEGRLAFVTERWEELTTQMPRDELDKLVGSLLDEGTRGAPPSRALHLLAHLRRLGYEGDAIRRLESPLIPRIARTLLPTLERLRVAVQDREPDALRSRVEDRLEHLVDLQRSGKILSANDPGAMKSLGVALDLAGSPPSITLEEAVRVLGEAGS